MTAAEFLEQWRDLNESPNFVRDPRDLDAQLLARMQAIDPVAFSDNNYWPWRFSMLRTPTR